MPKLYAQDLKNLFDIVSDIKEPRLEFCLDQAETTLRNLVTDAVYDLTTPDRTVKTLKFAEAHFAIYHLLLNTGLRIRRDGLIKKEQSSGDSVQNNAGNEYYTPEEIGDLREQFHQGAIEAANPLKPTATNRPKNYSFTVGGSLT